MDPVKALMLATIIQAAYSMPVNDDSPAPPGAVIEGYNVVAKLYGNDLATDIRPDRGDARISYGYVLTNSSGEAIVAIRGTEGIWEWLHDLMFLSVPCPVPGSVGFSEDGFSAIYRSLSLEPGSTTAIATERFYEVCTLLTTNLVLPQ